MSFHNRSFFDSSLLQEFIECQRDIVLLPNEWRADIGAVIATANVRTANFDHGLNGSLVTDLSVQHAVGRNIPDPVGGLPFECLLITEVQIESEILRNFTVG